EPSAVKVARWVLRGTTLGNRCRLLDNFVLHAPPAHLWTETIQHVALNCFFPISKKYLETFYID
ncbi:hypothetical protein ACPV5N_10445, partial [Vibrio alfacsensis]